ncbi:outer membrane lipoprotein chaperone LolA [Rhodoferax sp.]|uniref:outer membrane lipoprotein chaperone LolA n=1 Tax=Rhodoferax sp. TaxID=50421 RepID=UPI0025CBD3BC|nr:outer membrane lipoprotein chaperone LolA [Rhodoferax sp.]
MKQFAILLIAACAISARATGINDLESFVRTVKSGKAEFTQVVTAPPKDGQLSRSKSSSGTFEFSRPGRFKFVYKKPFEQTIVADGQTLWLYDVDLNQVTARKQAQALGSTPAALIASSADIKALQNDFALADAPDEGGLQWVLGSPKAKDNQLQSVRIGFRQNQLEKLEIVDTFGQKSVITFSGFQSNAVINLELFQFKPPAGADVVRQ